MNKIQLKRDTLYKSYRRRKAHGEVQIVLFTILAVIIFSFLFKIYSDNNMAATNVSNSRSDARKVSRNYAAQIDIEKTYDLRFKKQAENGLKLPHKVKEITPNIKAYVSDEEVTCIILKDSLNTYDVTCVNSKNEEFKIEPSTL